MPTEMTSESKWARVRGDGGTQPFNDDQLASLKEEFKQLCADAGDGVNDRRQLAEDTRFCRWENQSPDGKKHRSAGGSDPFPYEGASDARIRLADGIAQEQVIVIMAALMRLRSVVKPAEGTDAETAALVGQLWDWVLANDLGAEWFVEWTKLIQWRQGDTPGLGFMQVYWRQEYDVKPKTLNPENIIAETAKLFAAQGQPIGEGDILDLQDLLANPARLEELAALIQGLYPALTEKRAGEAAEQLVNEGEATVPLPYRCENRLAVRARRLFDDLFVPENTPSDEQRARVFFVREWFTRAELEEMDAKGVFKPGFVEEVLKHEGTTAYQYYSRWGAEGQILSEPSVRDWDKSKQRGMYELITAFYRGTSADGLPGTYTVQYHHAVDFAGTDAELLGYRMRGKRYPFRASQREILTNKLWDTRGVCELSMTEQQSLKNLHDMFMDNASLGAVPPLKVPLNRPRLQLAIEPLAQIKEQRQNEISWFPPPPFPQAADVMQEKILRQVSQYFGRMDAQNAPDWVRLYQQWLVDFVLLDAKEIIRMSLQLLEQFMPDGAILRALGPAGQRLIDIRNQNDESGGSGGAWMADVQVSFEAGMLNFEFIKAVGEMITNYVLQWDTLSIVQRDKLVRWYFSAISPQLAQELTVPVETANLREVEDEEAAFPKIATGVEPPQLEGQNYTLRLETLLGIGRKNPESYARLTPVSRQILAARIQYFQNQIQQQANAIIGRTMRQTALEPGAAPAA